METVGKSGISKAKCHLIVWNGKWYSHNNVKDKGFLHEDWNNVDYGVKYQLGEKIK